MLYGTLKAITGITFSVLLFIPSPLLVPSEYCHSLTALHSILKESCSQFGQHTGLHLTVGETQENTHHSALVINTPENPRETTPVLDNFVMRRFSREN